MNYIPNISFGPKDDLPENDPGKYVKGVEFDAEFDEISEAIISKEDLSNKGIASGYAPLNSSAVVDETYLPDATAAAQGISELATDAEAIAGTDAARVITPASLDAVLEQNGGFLADLATLVDPGTDSLIFWDDSADGIRTLTPSTGILISGTTMTVNSAGVDHDAASNFVANEHINHTAVSVIAGNGLTGGGTIAADRTINVVGTAPIVAGADAVTFAVSGLTELAAADIAGADEFYVSDGGTNKRMTWQGSGVPVTTGSAAVTLTSANCNRCYVLTGSTNRAMTINTSIGAVGNFLILTSTGTGLWTLGGTATRVGANGTSGMAAQYSVIILLCIAANNWVVFGDTV